ncbi:DUF4390 domain-containing protein [Lentisalinibacter sediminis]|uniref:DUF4390 domain-containing protein n=1 Tax=Lentisalinibacter sediminis TaxID=2992237 RepID=UPI0038662436
MSLPSAPAEGTAGRLWALLVLLACLAWQPASGQEGGTVAVRSADSNLVDGVYRVGARLQYVLSDEALDALDSGVPINVELQFQVIQKRRFWLDDVTAELAVNYQLLYNALSRRYVVRNLNTGEQDSYATLYSALNNLGRITSLPVIDAALLRDDRDYRIRMRAVVDVKDYPAALRLIVFWREDWRITSDWYEWQLER